MKILVTGCGGQLGQAVMDSSHVGEHEFIFTARAPELLSGGDRPEEVASGRPTVLPLDITDRDAVADMLGANDIDLILNCAGYTDVARAETEPEKARKINAEAVACLAEAARDNDALLIHISTDYIFDGKSSVPYTEEDVPLPVSEYGRSKIEGERAVMDSGCRYLIVRTSWLFSRYGHNFLKTILKKSAEQPSLTVVADQTGTPTYAPDLVDAIFHVINGNMTDRTGIYNYTCEGVCSWYEFAKEICAVAGRKCDVVPCRTEDYPSNVKRPRYSVLDKRKFKETFGVEISHWKDSVSVCVSEIEKFG